MPDHIVVDPILTHYELAKYDAALRLSIPYRTWRVKRRYSRLPELGMNEFSDLVAWRIMNCGGS